MDSVVTWFCGCICDILDSDAYLLPTALPQQLFLAKQVSSQFPPAILQQSMRFGRRPRATSGPNQNQSLQKPKGMRRSFNLPKKDRHGGNGGEGRGTASVTGRGTASVKGRAKDLKSAFRGSEPAKITSKIRSKRLSKRRSAIPGLRGVKMVLPVLRATKSRVAGGPRASKLKSKKVPGKNPRKTLAKSKKDSGGHNRDRSCEWKTMPVIVNPCV